MHITRGIGSPGTGGLNGGYTLYNAGNSGNSGVETGGPGGIIYHNGTVANKDQDSQGQGGGARGNTEGEGFPPFRKDEMPNATIGPVKPEQQEQWQADDENWEAFKEQYADEQQMREYILSLSEKDLQKLPEAMRFRAQLVIDAAYRNMQEYLSYQGYGNIPWLAAMVDGYIFSACLLICRVILCLDFMVLALYNPCKTRPNHTIFIRDRK